MLIAVPAIVAMLEVVAEARDGLEAVAKGARFDPTVILIDIRMPELDGLEAMRRIIAANDAARICRLLGTELSRFNPRADGWQG